MVRTVTISLAGDLWYSCSCSEWVVVLMATMLMVSMLMTAVEGGVWGV